MYVDDSNCNSSNNSNGNYDQVCDYSNKDDDGGTDDCDNYGEAIIDNDNDIYYEGTFRETQSVSSRVPCHTKYNSLHIFKYQRCQTTIKEIPWPLNVTTHIHHIY